MGLLGLLTLISRHLRLVSFTLVLFAGSMFVCHYRADFSCLRNFLFIFIIQSLIIHGFAREADKETRTQGLLLGNIQKEGKVKTPNAARGEMAATNKSKILKTDGSYDSQKQQFNILRQKRNAPPADEDLFEFMVRIANTPVEWERIRRILSRIKLEEKDNRSLVFSSNQTTTKITEIPTSSPITNKFPYNSQKYNTSSVTSSVQLSPQDIKRSHAKNESTEGWPSSDWIIKLIKYPTAEKDYSDNEDYYQDIDSAGEENESFREKNRPTNRISNIYPNDRTLLTNGRLPNFVYRRVIPDSRREEDSAYIAVSVVSPTDAVKKESDDNSSSLQEETWFDNGNYTNVEKLQSRRRHSRRKNDKT